MARIAKLLPDEPIQWVVELKIDGVAVALLYEQGKLVRGATRGNGRVGDDVTHNIRTVRGVPWELHGKELPAELEVRGEVYMTNSDLVRLNEEQAATGNPPFANTRNTTAGTIRVLDPRICKARRLRFFCHSTGYVEGLKAKTHQEFLDEMRSYGIPPTPHAETFANFDAAVEYCEKVIGQLHELDFEVDGLVLKVNRFDQRQRLGATSKSPRWMIAYKFEKFEAPTKLLDIKVSVGKSGASHRLPSSSRSNWPAASSAVRACTMPMKSSARTAASAILYCWKRPARLFRTSSAPKNICAKENWKSSVSPHIAQNATRNW